MNTLSRRRFAQISSLSLAAAVLAGCSGSSGSSGANTVTWSTWGSPEELKRYDAVQEQFKKDHPEVELVFQPTASYSDYHSKLLTQLSSGTAPDVFYVGDDRIASFIRNGVLLPIEGETSLDLDSFNSSLLDVARFEGALYALPNDCNPDCLWFDKEALKAAGITEDPATLAASDQWTTEAFFAMTAKLKAAGLNGACYWNYWGTHDSIISCGGGKVYDGDTYVANTDPASVKALEEYATRFRSGELIVADLLPEGTGEDSLPLHHRHDRGRRRGQGPLRHRSLAHPGRRCRAHRSGCLLPRHQRQDEEQGWCPRLLRHLPQRRWPGAAPERRWQRRTLDHGR